MEQGTPSWACTLTCLAGVLLATSTMKAQIDRSSPPDPGPAPVVHLGEHSTFNLANGMRAIVVQNHKLPIVGVQFRFDIAPVVQGDKVGYIDLLGELLMAGTATRTKAQIDETVDRLGASFHTTPDGLYASCLKKNLPELLDLIQDVLTAPAFPEAEFEKARNRLRSAVIQRSEDPDSIAEVVGRSVTFGSHHPYGEVMTTESLGRITVEHIRAYYHRYFDPEQGFVVFVGDITDQEARQLARDRFGKWRGGTKEVVLNEDGSEEVEGLGTVRAMGATRTPSGRRRVFIVDRPGAAQSVIRVSHPLNLQPRDIRAQSAQVMNSILGGGVFNARLMQNLREDKGWTYGAHSSLDSDRFNGSYTAAVSVRTAVTDSAIIEIIREMENMRDTEVTPEELELTKNYMAGSFGRSLEDPRTVARFALNTQLNDLPKDHYTTYLKRLDAVQVADVQASAHAFLHPDQAVILVVGDKKALLEKIKTLVQDPKDPVIELDVDGKPWKEELERVSDRSPQDVVDQYLEAIGGRRAIAGLKDLRIDQRAMVDGQEIQLLQWFGSDGTYRSELNAGGKVLRELVFDGKRGAEHGPTGTRELEDIELVDLRMNASPVPEIDLTRMTEHVALSGLATVNGRKAYRLGLTTHAGSSVADYYDAETRLKVQRVERKFLGGQDLTVTTTYADHRPVNGVLFPHTMEQWGGTMGAISFSTMEILVNVEHAPGFFATGLGERNEDEGEVPEGYEGED